MEQSSSTTPTTPVPANRIAQIVFVATLFFIIGWKKFWGTIYYLFTGDEMVSVDPTIQLVFLVVSLIGIILLILGMIFLVHAIRTINNPPQPPPDLSKTIMVEAPVSWIILNFMGWIYVEANTQVGLIGQQVYGRSGLFFQMPASPKRRLIISKQKVPYKATIETSSQDRKVLEVSISAICRIKTNQVSQLNEIHDPVAYLQSGLETGLTNLLQTNQSSFLKGNPALPAKKLNQLYAKSLPLFEISVQSLVCKGKDIDDEDEAARLAHFIRMEILRSNLRLQETTREKVIDLLVKTRMATGLATGKDMQKEIHQILEAISIYGPEAVLRQYGYTSGPEFPKNKPPQGLIPTPQPNQTGSVKQELFNALARSDFKLLNDEGVYEIEYRSYRISLSPDDTEQKIAVQLFDPQNISLGNMVWTKSLPELLVKLQKSIDKTQANR